MTEESAAVLVLDQGTHSCRLGLGSEDLPRVVARSLTALPRVPDVATPRFGREALDYSASHELHEVWSDAPDWDLLAQFWLHHLTDLQPEPSHAAVLSAHRLSAPRVLREQAAQLFFEQLRVPRFFSAPDPLLALYASGRVSGLVIGCGHAVSTAVPVLDGTVQTWAQSFAPLGGRALTAHLAARLTLGTEEAATLKENEARVPTDFAREREELTTARLPDGKPLRVATALLEVGESLFAPRVVGARGPGLAELACDALLKSEAEARRELAAAVIPCGGSTALPGLSERLQRDTERLLPCAPRVKVLAPTERANAVWAGGAVVSGLSSFAPLWVTRAEYEECGPAVVSRKAL